MTGRPRALIVAYACEPDRGSEPAAGWGLVQAVMASADCVVLVGAEHGRALRAWRQRRQDAAVTFIEVADPAWASMLRRHRIGRFLVYLAWLRRAAVVARRLPLAEFQFVWHATFSAYWLPTPAVDFGLPCVWGPVGGAIRTPYRLWPLLGLRGMLDEAVDYVAVRLMAMLPATRRTWRQAALILAQNERTAAQLPRRLRRGAVVVNHGLFAERGADRRARDPRCLFAGALESRKAPGLALRALATTPADVRLLFVGDGPERRRLVRLAHRLGVADRVEFAGSVSHATAVAMMADAAACVFTGLREEGGIGLAEAVACGTPVVVLAHGGAIDVASAAIDPERVALISPSSPGEAARAIGTAMTRFTRGVYPAAGDMLNRTPAAAVVQRVVSAFSDSPVDERASVDTPRGRPVATVVVATVDRAEPLRRALHSLGTQRTAFTYEILVVGNGSRPHIRDVVAACARATPVAMRYVHEPVRGVSHARNRGVSEARGEWVVFFDDDQIAEPDWLAELLRHADPQDAPCVGGRIQLQLPADAPVLSRAARILLGEHPFAGPVQRCVGRDLPSTGNLAVARRVFARVGLFDVSMTAGGEDSEIIRRIRRAGIPVLITPAAVVHHIIPGYRTTPAYIRSVAVRRGAVFAQIDQQEHGAPQVAVRTVSRVLHALAVVTPRLLVAKLRGDRDTAHECELLLWRCRGYLDRAAPRLLWRSARQHRYVDDWSPNRPERRAELV